MAKLSISLAQMTIHLGEPKRNFAQVEKWTVEAARRGSHIVVFPELWSTGYALDRARELSDNLHEGLFPQVAALAGANKISVVGSMLEKRGLESSNSAPFFAANGRMMGIYRKIHLFRLMDEDKYLQAGASPLTLDLPWGRTALAICYDLRFPELFRRYALEDVELVIIPAEWPQARIDHWRALMIARAIENQCYMIGVNTVGKIGETVFGGHSMIVDPWGRIVVEAGDEPQLITAEIELDRIKEVRNTIPVFEDRRPDTYEVIKLPDLP